MIADKRISLDGQSLEERALVPHHLLDVVTPDTRYSAGRYAEVPKPLFAEPDEKTGSQ